MAEFYFDNLARNLPDAYKKSNLSNNFKILEIERTASEELRTALDEIAAILDIENAQGAVLDMYGERFGQPRGKATDAQYRIMIKSKIRRALCDGSYKNIVDAICYTFGCSIDDVLIKETAPMQVKLENVSLKKVIEAGFSTSQAVQIVKSLLPTGVSLETVLLGGTFEFAETDNEYDESAGFGDADGTIGGYLGWLSTQNSIDELPI